MISIDVFVDYRGGGVVYISVLMRNVGWQRHSVGNVQYYTAINIFMYENE